MCLFIRFPSVFTQEKIYLVNFEHFLIFIHQLKQDGLVLNGRMFKRTGRDKDVSFYRVPVIIRNEGEPTEELTTERRRKWISAIGRDNIT